MTALLLDTTFLIDIERDDHDLDAWIDDDDDVAMAAVTVAELQVGVELASHQHRERRANFVQAIIEVVPVLPYGIDTALVHAGLLADTRRTGRPRGAHDLIIAATAFEPISAWPCNEQVIPSTPSQRNSADRHGCVRWR